MVSRATNNAWFNRHRQFLRPPYSRSSMECLETATVASVDVNVQFRAAYSLTPSFTNSWPQPMRVAESDPQTLGLEDKTTVTFVVSGLMSSTTVGFHG